MQLSPRFRHSLPRMGMVLLVLAGVVTGSLAALLTVNVASPMQEVEKPLDAAPFLASGQ